MSNQIGGTITWILDADNTQYKAGLAAASTQADAAASTIGGAFKGLAVVAIAALAAIGTGAYMAAKASFEQVDAVQQATVALKAYERDGAKVNTVLSDLVKYARSDLGVLFNRKDLFQSAQSLKLMGDNTSDLVGHVQILSRSVGLGLSTWDDLNLIVGRVGSTGRLTGEDFDNLTKAGFKLDPAMRNTDQTFQSLFAQLDKGIPADALAGQADTIQGKMIRLETAFRGVGDAIIGVDSDSGQLIKGGLGDIFLTIVGKITEAFKNPEFKQGIKDTVNGIVEGIRIFIDVVKQVAIFLQPVTDFIKNNKEAWEVLRISLIAIIAVIAGLIIIVGIGLVGAFALVMLIINAAIWVVQEIIKYYLWLGDAIAGLIWGLIQFGAKVSEIFSNFGRSVANAMNSAISWFQSLPGRILNAIGDLGNLLYNIGKSVVDGLINGIRDSVSKVGKAAGDIASSLQKKVKEALGIHSPSTVFAEIGTNIVAGMAQGITKSQGMLDSAMSTMTSSMMIPTQKLEMDSGSGSYNKEINVNQYNTINNPLDMTTALNDIAWKLGN